MPENTPPSGNTPPSDSAPSPVAIVTGASRGIGLAAAQALVDRGYRVAVTGRAPEPLAEAVAQLGGPEKALAVAGRAHDAGHREEVAARTVEVFGRLDAVVNNVGTNPVFTSLAELDLDAARKMLEINLLSALGLVQTALKHGLGEHGPASVVNVASLAGVTPSPGLAFYGVTKAGLINLTEQLAFELAPRVRVNAVAPAVVKTKFAALLYESGEEETARSYPLGRLGVPEDVGSAIAFLAGPDSSWITGQTLVLDGGKLLTGGV